MEFKVFSARIAGNLHEQGFKIIKTEPNLKNPKLKVFIFEKTPDFEKAFSLLMKKS